MKHISTLLFAFMLTTVMAQVTISPGTLSTVISEEIQEHVFNVSVTNASATPVSLWWKVGKGANFPAAWQTYMCDVNQCYIAGVEACPASKPNVIAANSTVIFTFHLQPGNTVGSGKMYIQLYSDKSFKTLVAETDKEGLVVADKLLNTKVPGNSDIKVFPNPADDYFIIKNDAAVAKVSIFNIVGKEIETFRHVTGTSYNVSDYVRGIYIVRLIDSRGKTIKSIRLNKR